MNKIFNFERELISKKFNKNKTILEYSKYKNIALWWYVDLDFFNFLLYSSNRKMKVSEGKSNKGKKFKNFFIKELFRFLDYFLKLGSIFLVHSLNKTDFAGKKNEGKWKVLITGEDIEWRPIFINFQKNFKLTDQFFDPILCQMETMKKFNVVSIYPLKYPFYNSIFTFISKFKNWNVRHIPFNYYFDSGCDKKRVESQKYFEEIWSEIENDAIFNELLLHYDPTQSLLIKQKIKSYFIYEYSENAFPEFVKMIEMSMNVIDSIQPDIILLEEEYGIFERSLLIAAKLKEIPTIAIQHGVIHAYHKGYLFDDN